MDDSTRTHIVSRPDYIKCFEVSIPGDMLGYVYTMDAETAVAEAERIWGDTSIWNADKYIVKQLTPEIDNG
jgi:hypothetical protein